ncbi:hypothetical protein Tco_0237358 [Tanacetum coccineum]
MITSGSVAIPLEQVHGNPTMPVQTRRLLATDPVNGMIRASRRWMIIPDALILGKSTSGRDTVPWGLACTVDVKETKNALQCISAEAEYVASICKLCLSNVDEDTLQVYVSTTTKYRLVLRLSVSHSNIMQPRTHSRPMLIHTRVVECENCLLIVNDGTVMVLVFGCGNHYLVNGKWDGFWIDDDLIVLGMIELSSHP